MYNNVRTVAYHLSDMYTCPHMYTQWEIRPFRPTLVLAQKKYQWLWYNFHFFHFFYSYYQLSEDLTISPYFQINLVLPWFICYICVARLSPMIDDQVDVITLTVNM